MSSAITILGSGYTGRHLAALLGGTGRAFFATSRDPHAHLPHIPASQQIQFNLSEPSTWTNIPHDADLLWCFPAQPIESVRNFATAARLSSCRMVVLGSTSAYDIAQDAQDYPPAWIDETAPIDLSKPRVQGEEYLREHHGAIVLRVAGIYGPGRNPLEWITSGRVAASHKYVNLIHVEDLAAICLAAIEKGRPGEVYNVSDGTPRTWADIDAVGKTRYGIAATTRRGDADAGKRISTAKLTSQLGTSIRHPDLYEAIEKIIATAP